MLAEFKPRRGWTAATKSVLFIVLVAMSCSGAGPHCEERKVKGRLNDPQQTAVEWKITACVEFGEETTRVTVSVTGETVPGGAPVTPGRVVVVERDGDDQRVDAHDGTNNGTVDFNADSETKSISVSIGKNTGMVVTEDFSVPENP